MSSGSVLLRKLLEQRSVRENELGPGSRISDGSYQDGQSASVVRALPTGGASLSGGGGGGGGGHEHEHEHDETMAMAMAMAMDATVEVCLGPDCSSSGGGAALLEIEDLLDGWQRKNICPRVAVGGCRDHCTIGPNVYIRGQGIADSHHPSVDGPDACRRVVSHVVAVISGGVLNCSAPCDQANAVNRGGSDDISIVSSARLLTRREDGRRWRALRERAARERRLRVRERPSIQENTEGG